MKLDIQSIARPTRREFMKTTFLGGMGAVGAISAAAAGLALPCVSQADEADVHDLPWAGLTLAEFEMLMDPEHYASLSSAVKEELGQYRMYETPSGTEGMARRSDVGGSVYFDYVSVGYHQVAFSFQYHVGVSCDQLFARVTISNGGYDDAFEFYGAGTSLTGRNTFSGVPSGTCSVVVTAYAPIPAPGYSSMPRQAYRTVTV